MVVLVEVQQQVMGVPMEVMVLELMAAQDKEQRLVNLGKVQEHYIQAAAVEAETHMADGLLLLVALEAAAAEMSLTLKQEMV